MARISLDFLAVFAACVASDAARRHLRIRSHQTGAAIGASTGSSPPSTQNVEREGYHNWWNQVLDEVPHPTKLIVQGMIPLWLSGTLLRNGPGLWEMGGQEMHHAFDGLAKPNKWLIKDGEVQFQTRFLQSKLFNATIKAHRVPEHMTLLPVTPKYNKLQRATAMMNKEYLDNSNICIWKTGDAYFGTADMQKEMRFDFHSLESLDYMQYKNDLGSVMHLSGAHRQPAFAKELGGETIGWIGSINKWPPWRQKTMKLKVYRDSKDLTRHWIGEVDTDFVALIHSFAVTENYVVIMVPNVGLDLGAAVKNTVTANSFNSMDSLKWHGDKKAKIHVFDAHSNDSHKAPLRTFHDQPMYLNHHVNAYEEGDTIVMDLIAYKDGSFMQDKEGFGNRDVMKDLEKARSITSKAYAEFRRYRLDMQEGSNDKVDFELLPVSDGTQNFAVEMPRFNEVVKRGRKYCFVYALTEATGNNAIVKIDVCNGGRAKVWSEPNQYPSEPIFVPRPAALEEDDGVVVSVVLDGPNAKSYLLVLNARTMEDIAKVYAPLIIPVDIHGYFYQDDEMFGNATSATQNDGGAERRHPKGA